MDKRILPLIICMPILAACSSTPDYTNDVAPDLCAHMNIDEDSRGYAECFSLAANVTRTYPDFNMAVLAEQAELICDEADIEIGDDGYPACFKSVTMPMVESQGVAPPTWDTILQKMNLIRDRYNS